MTIWNDSFKWQYEKTELDGYGYYFSVDYNAIVKSDIVNIHKCLMVKINIKCFGLLSVEYINNF